MKITFLAAALLVLPVACSGDDEPTTLRPADEVTDERNADRAATGELDGDSVELGPLRVALSSARTSRGNDGPALSVTVRVENPAGDDNIAPELHIICAGAQDPGGYIADDQHDYRAGAEVPAGSFYEERILLEHASGCDDMEVQAELVSFEGVGDPPIARWPIEL